MKTCISLLLTIVTFASVAVAQSTKDKLEIGVQTTSLTLVQPDFFLFDDTQTGIGGRVTYNFNRSIAAEAEINWFPERQPLLNANGRMIQAQFGAKVGKRFEKFGLFAKVRPGFLSVGDVISLGPGPPRSGSIFPVDFRIERRSFFTVDVGGVLELYPSKRLVVRFDAGDTAIRHPARFDLVFTGPTPTVQRTFPPRFTHNFQFTAGVAFRLGDFPDEESNQTSSGGQERTKRYEVGVQFTSLFVRPTDEQRFNAAILPREHTEPGFGGRFTFNLTENVAFEAEGNYFTREQLPFPQGGRMFQGQFGGKVGKRFDRWGLFGKARPGFVGFTKVFPFLFGAQIPAVIPFERRYYPSVDLGGVVELYVSPRWMARFDVGDTLIRYPELQVLIGQPTPFTVQRKQTRNNLQISSGIGFRF